MRKFISLTLAAVVLAASVPVSAGSNLISQPVQLNGENIRYQHGQATIDMVSETGSVQIRPAVMDHGSLAFNIAVFNNGSAPANIDVTNFSLSAGTANVGAFSVETLTKRAKSRAAWATFAVALAGGLSAASAASQRDHYTSTFVTPRGTYRSYYSAPSVAGQYQAAVITAGTGVGVYAIQHQLDKTLEALGNQVVQLTTVDPGDSYGGTIVFQKVALSKLPARVTMTVDWNGHKYPFTFQVAKPGTPAPPFTPVVIAAPEAPAAAPAPVQPLQSTPPATPSPTTVAAQPAPAAPVAPTLSVPAPAPTQPSTAKTSI